MRAARVACLLLLGLCLPLLSEAQSLGSVAKKERDRREKNKKQGVAAREFSEEEIFGPTKEEKASEGEAVTDAESSGEASEEIVIPGPSPNPEDDIDPLEKGSRKRRRNEAEWRSRAADARSRVADARERVRFFEELYLGPEEYYVDENGRTVIGSTEELQRMTREAKEELAAAEASWKQLQEEARRSGIPPGWLR
ncbi:MAG TPA: hypothetical protein VEK15_05230 [Vicinamibacteria bacterium]|nr:hypothetical protein [Vicinamibacteria bacterium]